MLDALLRKLARSLLMRREEVDVKKPTAAYGVDSLVAVELRNWFSREARCLCLRSSKRRRLLPWPSSLLERWERKMWFSYFELASTRHE